MQWHVRKYRAITILKRKIMTILFKFVMEV